MYISESGCKNCKGEMQPSFSLELRHARKPAARIESAQKACGKNPALQNQKKNSGFAKNLKESERYIPHRAKITS
jgi:hypothetical protein